MFWVSKYINIYIYIYIFMRVEICRDDQRGLVAHGIVV